MKTTGIQQNAINTDDLQKQCDNLINVYCDKYGINLKDYKERSNIKHNEVNNILRFIYNNLFKPDKPQINNKKSLLNYDDIEQLQIAADLFINICMLFNKSLGLWSFSLFTGIDDNTIIRWFSEEGKKLNLKRWEILKSIKEFNKAALISNLKDTPVGALAVANNDHETGLEWSYKQALTAGSGTVFLIPSERVNRLQIPTEAGPALPGPEVSGNK